MVVIDQTQRVPRLDDELLGKLAESLDREGVVAASLIGSQARGQVAPLSDIDLGVWCDPGLDAAARLRLRLDLAAAAARAVGTEEIDLVLLNGATPLFRHRAVRDGRRLLERDPRARVRFEARAMLDFLDTKPLREELARGQRHRLEEGRFGRR